MRKDTSENLSTKDRDKLKWEKKEVTKTKNEEESASVNEVGQKRKEKETTQRRPLPNIDCTWAFDNKDERGRYSEVQMR